MKPHQSRAKSGRNQSKKLRPQQTALNREALPEDAVEIEIESLSHDGRGVGKYQGKTAFISGALPGETVTAQLQSDQGKFYEGTIEQCLQPSSHRIDPICPHYDICGGCDLQHLAQDEQLRLKQEQVLDQLARIGKNKPAKTLPSLTGPDRHYRRSARVGINQLSDGEPIIGFRRAQSNRLCQIDECVVLDPRVADIFQEIREALTDSGDIKHITQIDIDLGDMATSTDCPEGYLSLRLKKALSDEHKAFFTALSQKRGLSLQLQIIGEAFPQPERLAEYQLDDLRLQFRPGDFIQINAEINQQMVKQALELLELSDEDHLLDLFCGLGNFSLPAAQRASSVVGVEGSLEMVRQAEENAELNGISNTEFYCANLNEDMKPFSWYKKGYNKVLLDPPRAGAANIISQLIALRPVSILYIACNPGALARDSREFLEQGYQLDRFLVMDMFPQTHHVEAMALFKRGKKPQQKKKLFGGRR
ncbi:MAG: 23S rRNA (uracil(1939)-C(5))-methyltransferase RlmD [Amphritea sp.]|nr:23S rRNA (uracil(1939)-C(5))-methyltransferase RlmD [Amphritea sp.]